MVAITGIRRHLRFQPTYRDTSHVCESESGDILMPLIETFPHGLHLPNGGVTKALPGLGGALLRADNIRYFSDGAGRIKIKARKGRTQFDTDSNTDAVLALRRFYDVTNGLTRTMRFTTVSGPNVTLEADTNDDGAFTAVSGGTGLTSTAKQRTRMVAFPEQNAVFVTNYGDNLRTYNGTTLAAVAVVSGVTIDGGLIEEWGDRLWATRKDFPHVVYATDFFNPSKFIYTLNVVDENGGGVTGLKHFHDRLVIFKSTATFVHTGDIRFAASGQGALMKASDKGAVSSDAIVRTPFGIVYVSDDGIYLTQGRVADSQDISVNLHSLFSGNTIYDEAVMHWDAYSEVIRLKLAPSDTHTWILARFDIPGSGAEPGEQRVLWSKDTNTPMTCAASWPGEGDDRRVLVGASDGKIWRVDTGTQDGSTDIPIDVIVYPGPFGERGELGSITTLEPFFAAKSPITLRTWYGQFNPDTDDPRVEQPVGRYTDATVDQIAMFSDKTYRWYSHFVAWGVHVEASNGDFRLYAVNLKAKRKASSYRSNQYLIATEA